MTRTDRTDAIHGLLLVDKPQGMSLASQYMSTVQGHTNTDDLERIDERNRAAPMLKAVLAPKQHGRHVI